MTATDQRATHRAFGITWAMPFAFGVFTPVDEEVPADVVVEEGRLPDASPQARRAGPLREVDGLAVRFRSPGDTARALITNGNRILLERNGSSDESAALLLMGPAPSIILHQRGVLPLHGSGVVTDAGVVLLVGHSGAGKSTTLGALIDRGYPAVCDDLAAVSLGDSGPVVHPGTRALKVWADSAQALGWPTDNLPRVRTELSKFIAPIRVQTTEAVPLAAIYQLSVHNGDTVVLEPRERAAKFNAVLDHTWQKMTVKRMGLHGAHFERAVRVANAVPVVRVRRPDGVPISESGLVEAILADVARLPVPEDRAP